MRSFTLETLLRVLRLRIPFLLEPAGAADNEPRVGVYLSKGPSKLAETQGQMLLAKLPES